MRVAVVEDGGDKGPCVGKAAASDAPNVAVSCIEAEVPGLEVKPNGISLSLPLQFIQKATVTCVPGAVLMDGRVRATSPEPANLNA